MCLPPDLVKFPRLSKYWCDALCMNVNSKTPRSMQSKQPPAVCMADSPCLLTEIPVLPAPVGGQMHVMQAAPANLAVRRRHGRPIWALSKGGSHLYCNCSCYLGHMYLAMFWVALVMMVLVVLEYC